MQQTILIVIVLHVTNLYTIFKTFCLIYAFYIFMYILFGTFLTNPASINDK